MNTSANFIGQLGGGFDDSIIALVAIFFVFGTPMVAMLLHHQRKMAETLRGDRSQNDQISQLQNQVNQLAHLVHQQTITLDDLRSRTSLASQQAPPQMEERFTNLNEP
jgi:uncharacterized protein YlxW (UPF0749 family)